ncbi:hypothetical protein HN51_058550, partial [Arachis hypogaea]
MKSSHKSQQHHHHHLILLFFFFFSLLRKVATAIHGGISCIQRILHFALPRRRL